MLASRLHAITASSIQMPVETTQHAACIGAHMSTHVSRRQRLDTEARQPPLTAVRLTSRRVRLVSASTHGMLCTNIRSMWIRVPVHASHEILQSMQAQR